jgi:hypothetical protein
VKSVQVGDRVRVVFEGEVTETRGSWFDINGHVVWPTNDAVQSIEVLKSPVKVGDFVWKDEVDQLPPGSVVIGTASRARHFRTDEGWQADSAGAAKLEITSGFYEVEFIPGAAA